MRFSTVGKNFLRTDGFEKVTGEAQFTPDFKFAGLLTAKIIRSPHAHARIKKIDISAAEKIAGVKKIVTGYGCNKRIELITGDQPPIAVEKVRFVGEPVAAVIAEDEEIATYASSLVKIEYEPLPAVFDVYDALKKDAPLVHPAGGTNIFHHYKLKKGTVEKGFQTCDLILENDFSIPHISHTQLETHSCVALWKKEGFIEMTSSTQSPFVIREVLSKMFNLPHSKIRVHVPYVGGGFGGKSDVTIEPLVAYISQFVPGFPVRLVLSREEAFCGSLLGRGMKGKIKTGVKKDGKIVAVEIQMYFNSGAYADYCLPVVCGGGQNACGPYMIDNIKVDAYGVYTNLPFVGAFRGYGHPEGNWLTERQLDIIAKKLGIDPVQIRLKNCWKPGGTNQIGQIIKKHNGRLDVCIKKAAAAIEWDKDRKVVRGNKIIAKGLACFMKSPVMTTNAASCALVKFAPDGSINLSMGTIDYGQGALTALSQICAERIQLPFEKIHMSRETDTQFSPYEWQTVASRGTWSVGNAIVAACDDAIEKIKQNAVYVFKTPAKNLVYEKGFVFIKNNRKKKIPIEQLIHGYMFEDGHTEGGPVVGYGYFMPNIQNADKETGQGRCVGEWTGGCQSVIIEIDTETGVITPIKMVTAIDAGKIVNPKLARGQLVGAMVQALGSAIYEGIIYSDKGKMRSDHFTDYKIPTPEDVFNCDMEVIFIETPEEGGPFGARSLAEHPVVALPSAIGNAVQNGTGIDFFELPITSDKLLIKLKEK